MGYSEAVVERIKDPEEIRSLFKVRQAHKHVENQLIDMLASSGAILRGHFELESGDHAQLFFRFTDVASRIDYVELIIDELIGELQTDSVTFDAVLVQQSAGRVLGEMLRRKLGKRKIVAAVDEHNQPNGTLINETDLYPHDKVLVLVDMSTTGSSLLTMLTSVRDSKAVPVAVALFATRNEVKLSEFARNQSIRVYALGDLAFEEGTVPKPQCRLCKESKPVPSWEI